MEIVWSALTCFLTILIFVVPFLGLLLCLCFGFIANYRKKIASYLTTSIWLFWGQVLFYFVIYFHIIYISNKPSTLFILDIHPLPRTILFSLNWFLPLFISVILQVLLLHSIKKFTIPTYLRNSMFALIFPIIGCLIVAYLVSKDFAYDIISSYGSILSSVWWLW